MMESARSYHLVNALTNREPLTVIESLVNGHPQVLTWKDATHGRTPLHHAMSEHANLDIIQYLLHQCPASLAMVDDNEGQTPLHVACQEQLPVEFIRLLLDACPKAAEMKDGNGETALHSACCGDGNFQTIQMLLSLYPPAACLQNEIGFTPLHIACGSPQDVEVIQYLAHTWPIACLLYSNEREDCEDQVNMAPLIRELQRQDWRYEWEDMCGTSIIPPQLPLEVAETRRRESSNIITLMAQITMEAACGLIEASFHQSSDFPPAVVSLIKQSLGSETLANIKANGMMTNESIELTAVKDLFKNEAVQTMLQDKKFASVIHGFIQMNRAGRKEAIKESAGKILIIVVCESVSENVDCLFAHLRENPSLCQRRKPTTSLKRKRKSQQLQEGTTTTL